MLAFVGCERTEIETPDLDAALELYYVNTFAANCMHTYYLWSDEIASSLDAWDVHEDPIAKVEAIRYKDASGHEVDKWTMITDDFSSFSSSVSGVNTTYGCSLALYYYDSQKTTVCAVVRYTSADSPASKAGLKRGDTIVKVAGQTMTEENYRSLIYDSFLYAPSTELVLEDGRQINMKAVEMYEDPVLVMKTFDCGAKKVGYLVYNRFTLDSWKRLIEASDFFRSEGVSELILDMRYNPGGYVKAEETLASMLAPEEAVKSGSVFETSVYNSLLTKEIGNSESKFTSKFNFSSGGHQYSYSTEGKNMGLEKIYVILTSGSASASESIVVGLMPYVPIEIIGQQSGGKYCTGLMYSASEWYDDYKSAFEADEYTAGKRYTANWGMYVMIARYADKDGNTPCMPDGFVPDVPVDDVPYEPYELGDEREAMLRVALQRAGKKDLAERPQTGKRAPRATRTQIPQQVNGYRIELL